MLSILIYLRYLFTTNFDFSSLLEFSWVLLWVEDLYFLSYHWLLNCWVLLLVNVLSLSLLGSPSCGHCPYFFYCCWLVVPISSFGTLTTSQSSMPYLLQPQPLIPCSSFLLNREAYKLDIVLVMFFLNRVCKRMDIVLCYFIWPDLLFELLNGFHLWFWLWTDGPIFDCYTT